MRWMDISELRAALDRLTDLLVEREPLWRPRPFAERPPRWALAEPELAAWASGLSVGSIDALEVDPTSRPVHPRYAALRDEALAAAQIGAPFEAPPVAPARDATWRTPGRKLAQACALAGVAAPLVPHAPRFVDWCGGKGHLSRVLALHTGGRARVVDRDEALLRAGDRLHRRAGLHTEWCRANVLRDPGEQLAAIVADADLAVGLHSCGALTDALVDAVLATDVDVHLSVPCCPHVVRDRAGYRPRSAPGRTVASGYGRVLHFDRIALRLAIADEIVARAADRRTRRREMAWRLGVDRLLREAGITNRYESLGNISTADFQRPFDDFCRWALAPHGASLPAGFDADAAESRAWADLREVRGFALVRALYRRALEAWIVVDKALHLAESGRVVAVGPFCPRTVTPRNLLVASVSPRRA